MAVLNANVTPPGPGDEKNLKKEVESLRRELFALYESLDFVLKNLDADNFSDAGLLDIKERIDNI